MRDLLGEARAANSAMRAAELRIEREGLADTGLGVAQSADQETVRELVEGPLGRHLLAIGMDRYERARESARSEVSGHTDRPGKGLKLVGVLGVLLAALLAREVFHQRRRRGGRSIRMFPGVGHEE